MALFSEFAAEKAVCKKRAVYNRTFRIMMIFLYLWKDANLLLTDSGGLQVEQRP